MEASDKNSEQQPAQCLTPGCNRAAEISGDCRPCYQNYMRMIRRKEIMNGEVVTRDRLEKAGLLLPAKKGPPVSPARAAVMSIEVQQQVEA